MNSHGSITFCFKENLGMSGLRESVLVNFSIKCFYFCKELYILLSHHLNHFVGAVVVFLNFAQFIFQLFEVFSLTLLLFAELQRVLSFEYLKFFDFFGELRN